MKTTGKTSDLSLLGIECGGTRSIALFSPGPGQEPLRMEAGPANLHLLNEVQLIKLFRNFSSIHKDLPDPHGIAIGMPGTRTEAHRQSIRHAAARVWPKTPCYATNDLETALAAADDPPGKVGARVLIISGTGSCCFGRTVEGKTLRYGGWGHILGDKGSGYQIGHHALKTVIQQFDFSGVWPPLGEKILSALRLVEPDDLIGWAVNADKAEVAALAEVVFEAWEQFDQIAMSVITAAAQGLAMDAANCAHRLVKTGTAVQFIFSGSILTKQPEFATLVGKHLKTMWRNTAVTRIKREGAWGALELARRHFLKR